MLLYQGDRLASGTGIDSLTYWGKALARISHTLSTAARDKAASTSFRLITVLDVLFKYASAR